MSSIAFLGARRVFKRYLTRNHNDFKDLIVRNVRTAVNFYYLVIIETKECFLFLQPLESNLVVIAWLVETIVVFVSAQVELQLHGVSNRVVIISRKLSHPFHHVWVSERLSVVCGFHTPCKLETDVLGVDDFRAVEVVDDFALRDLGILSCHEQPEEENCVCSYRSH